MSLRETRIEKALLYLEPGPLVLVTTSEGGKDNVMTISWTMPLDFDGHFAMATGPWNYSFKALKKTRECAVCIPPASMLETAAKIGSVSGADCDKFALFGLNGIASKTISAPCIEGCIACIESKVVKYMPSAGIFVLKATRLISDSRAPDKRIIHARGDGTFTADGQTFNFRKIIKDKLPPGL